jgi:hypothetical protein
MVVDNNNNNNNNNNTNKIHCIIVLSSPFSSERRYELAVQFLERMRAYEDHLVMYVVEMVYPSYPVFRLTSSTSPRHLQVRAPTPLWHKENMVNLGVRHLLPADWKTMAWIDADVEFESSRWAEDALCLLQPGGYDVVQLFSYAVQLNRHDQATCILQSFGQQHVRGMPYETLPGVLNSWHPGYGYAITRGLYDRMGGLLDRAICGGADRIMAFAFLGQIEKAMPRGVSEDFRRYLAAFQERMGTVRLGYVPTVLRHYYHGDPTTRKYTARWSILARHGFHPDAHVQEDDHGVLVPSLSFPPAMGEEILLYFKDRDDE